MTLRDHYRDKADSNMSTFSPGVSSDDWAFEFINAKYLQPIMEAFDDDGSGYVTYQEVNEFVDLRPAELNWRYGFLTTYFHYNVAKRDPSVTQSPPLGSLLGSRSVIL